GFAIRLFYSFSCYLVTVSNTNRHRLYFIPVKLIEHQRAPPVPGFCLDPELIIFGPEQLGNSKTVGKPITTTYSGIAIAELVLASKLCRPGIVLILYGAVIPGIQILHKAVPIPLSTTKQWRKDSIAILVIAFLIGTGRRHCERRILPANPRQQVLGTQGPTPVVGYLAGHSHVNAEAQPCRFVNIRALEDHVAVVDVVDFGIKVVIRVIDGRELTRQATCHQVPGSEYRCAQANRPLVILMQVAQTKAMTSKAVYSHLN